MRRAHRIERELPAAALQDAEAQQDGDRADVGHDQIQEARLADLGDAMLGHDQKYEDSAIVSHATMKL
jgi:hypothetical protein